jgi:hypothetical protein
MLQNAIEIFRKAKINRLHFAEATYYALTQFLAVAGVFERLTSSEIDCFGWLFQVVSFL